MGLESRRGHGALADELDEKALIDVGEAAECHHLRLGAVGAMLRRYVDGATHVLDVMVRGSAGESRWGVALGSRAEV